MLIREILYENSTVVDSIINDLIDYIITFKQKNKTEIPMVGPAGAVTYLNNLGHDVNVTGLISLLSDDRFSDLVQRSDHKVITLNNDSSSSTGRDQLAKSKETVEKTAAKVSNNAIKTGDLG